jgi:hypothetical protein
MLYFAYGANIDQNKFLKRCPLAKNKGVFKLNNYHICFIGVSSLHNGKGASTIVPNKNYYVEGILWNIPYIDIHKLDRMEGYPHRYKKIKFKTPYGEAFTYVTISQIQNEPDCKYFEDILFWYEIYGFNKKNLIDAYINSL